MELSGGLKPIILSLIFGVSITLTLPRLTLGAARGAARSGRSRATRGCTGNIANGLEDLLVGAGVNPPINKSSLFSNLSLCQHPNRGNLPKSTFRHVGWTADTGWKSYSQDTGSMRRTRRGVDPRIVLATVLSVLSFDCRRL